MIQFSFGKVRMYPGAALFNEHEPVRMQFGQGQYIAMQVAPGAGCEGCALNIKRLARACTESQQILRCSERMHSVFKPGGCAAEDYQWEREFIWFQDL